MQRAHRSVRVALGAILVLVPIAEALAAIPAAHVYHNHMPNFWPFYAVDVQATYNATAIGAPIRYYYDGQVISLKNNPPAGYSYYLPAAQGGGIMPHDDLVSYYSHHAKTGAYMSWPMQVANELWGWSAAKGQVHVTMSGAVINNVQSLNALQNVPGYGNSNWGQSWLNTYNSQKTINNHRVLDTIHFTGHHSMGPLVGEEYFLKDLIYQNATLAQPYFLGGSFTSSKGFFPTELGFSPRLVPALARLGIQWSVLGNNHLSRTLTDYPYATYDATGDTLTSPPNRADLRNTSNIGAWVANGMAHEQQVVVNKFPFASTPHWIRHVDAATGAVTQVAGIPVSQNGSWLEGWDGSATVDEIAPYQALEPRQFFVIAHDGDNSSGRAGSLDTWQAGYNVTCSGNGYCLGIDEYLRAFPIPASDVAHVQDGSWIDTRDSSSDPTWYHWHLPMMIWKGQFADFNRVTGLNLAPKKNLRGLEEGATVSLEHGWHYLERNFALLQAALNYAKTAEQIWLDANPSHWSPTTALDNQITHPGNQLNPWMLSYPLKGNAASNYSGGANPAELAWYFLLPAMDSGFGYYDENKDDSVKPTLAFNNSLSFSKPYVASRIVDDRTGPSLWWPQRYPYNPGSVNGSKAEGWTVQHYSKDFAIYTYGFDVSGIASARVMIRPHTGTAIAANDDTYKVFDPAAMVGRPGLSITPTKVGAWQPYPMQMRDLRAQMNGVDWVKTTKDTLQVLPAQEIGGLYYSYISAYRNQYLDYYVEMTDVRGNVSKSEIQQVYVGAGTYRATVGGSGFVEDSAGIVQGVYPFLVIDSTAPSVPGSPTTPVITDRSVTLSWAASTDNVGVTGYQVFRDNNMVGTSAGNGYIDNGLTASTSYSYQVLAVDAAGNQSARSAALSVSTRAPDTVAPGAPGAPLASNITASSATLSWSAATDNYGVAQYLVLRNGVQIATVTGLGYIDSTLSPSTTYIYTIRAQDAAGNSGPASGATSVSSLAGNVATVYYRPAMGWTLTNIHHAPTGGAWTAVPGVAMSAACAGWKMHTVNLGAASGLAAVFNNGAGVWDNRGGQNYTLGTGISVVENGGIATGTSPCIADTQAPSVPSGLAAIAIDANSARITWTASTDNVGVLGYRVYRGGTQIAEVTSGTSYTDNALLAQTAYVYKLRAYDAAGNVSTDSASVGVTTPAPVDTQAPSVPVGLSSSGVTTNAATVAWTASTDNVAVAAYLLLRNGVQVASTAALSYSDTGLTAGATYNYSVKAQDAVGNTSAASAALAVTLSGGNSATVYHRVPSGWALSNIHYAATGSSWTAVPGVAMDPACSGWKMQTVALGAATALQAVFNNGSGSWDNNGGNNYQLTAGISAIQNGAVSKTNPCSGGDTTAPSVPAGLAKGSVTATSVALSWTASTDNVGVTGYDVLRGGVKIGSTAGTAYTDTTVSASSTYSFSVRAYDAVGNTSAASTALSVSTPAPGCVVSFSIANAATVVGQNLYVVGNQAQLGSWSPGSGFALTIQGSGANVPWTGSVTLPAATAIQYKYVKWNGSTATWESNQSTASGNREFATPASCTGAVVRGDGNFKF
jgi:chitodextrinase